MAFLPIGGIIPQATANGNQANGQVLKFYEPGTLTPLAVGIDSTGVTLTAEFVLDIQGYTTLSNNKEIPHTNQIYKVVLYLDQADADANDTGSAVFVADDVDMVGSLSDALAEIDKLNLNIASASTRPLEEIKADENIAVGDFAQSSEYRTGSGVGAGLYEKVSANPGDNLINPATTDENWLKLIPNGLFNVYQAGAIGDGVADDNAAFSASADFSDVVWIPEGDYNASPTFGTDKIIYGSGLGVTNILGGGLVGVGVTLGSRTALRDLTIKDFDKGLKSGDSCHIIRVESTFNNIGVDLENSFVSTYELCKFTKNNEIGAVLSTNALGNEFYSCIIDGNGGIGVLQIRQSAASFYGCKMENNFNVAADAGCGVFIAGQLSKPMNLNGCFIERNRPNNPGDELKTTFANIALNNNRTTEGTDAQNCLAGIRGMVRAEYSASFTTVNGAVNVKDCTLNNTWFGIIVSGDDLDMTISGNYLETPNPNRTIELNNFALAEVGIVRIDALERDYMNSEGIRGGPVSGSNVSFDVTWNGGELRTLEIEKADLATIGTVVSTKSFATFIGAPVQEDIVINNVAALQVRAIGANSTVTSGTNVLDTFAGDQRCIFIGNGSVKMHLISGFFPLVTNETGAILTTLDASDLFVGGDGDGQVLVNDTAAQYDSFVVLSDVDLTRGIDRVKVTDLYIV